MRFLDYNGNGGLDPQDIATSIVVEEATREEDLYDRPKGKPLEANAGCATMAAFIILPLLVILIAL